MTQQVLAYFGHHKCATQWMNSIIRGVCRVIDRQLVIYNNPRSFDHDLRSSIAEPGKTFLSYTNADERYVSVLGELRGFHMVRDPRDVVVSAYFSHLHSHPEFGDLAKYREKLQSVSKEEGLMLEIDRRAFQFDMMLRWDYGRDDILEVRMESLTEDPGRELPRIASFLRLEGEGLDRSTLRSIVARNDFRAKAGRPRGSEDVTSHYRKGVAGDWMTHFTDQHVAHFKARYNDLLLKLGYEESPDWTIPGSGIPVDAPRSGADQRP